MKKIVLDMDRVVVKVIWYPQVPYTLLNILIFLFHWSFIFFPSIIEKSQQSLFENNRVVIVSKRPWFCFWITKLWFIIRRLKVERIYCIGLKGDKNKIINKEVPISAVIDDKAEENFDPNLLNINCEIFFSIQEFVKSPK